MDYIRKKLEISHDLMNKIENACNYNGAKYDFYCGAIIDITKTNIKYINPHKFIIRKKGYYLVVLCYYEDEIYLYERGTPITITQLIKIIKSITFTCEAIYE